VQKVLVCDVGGGTYVSQSSPACCSVLFMRYQQDYAVFRPRRLTSDTEHDDMVQVGPSHGGYGGIKAVWDSIRARLERQVSPENQTIAFEAIQRQIFTTNSDVRAVKHGAFRIAADEVERILESAFKPALEALGNVRREDAGKVEMVVLLGSALSCNRWAGDKFSDVINRVFPGAVVKFVDPDKAR
jgi:hypothetical protein